MISHFWLCGGKINEKKFANVSQGGLFRVLSTTASTLILMKQGPEVSRRGCQSSAPAPIEALSIV